MTILILSVLIEGTNMYHYKAGQNCLLETVF